MPDGAHYTAVVDTWYDLDNNGAHLTNSDTFVTGNEYQATVVIYILYIIWRFLTIGLILSLQ